ncbi:MAG: RimK family protein, partial [Bdellovibrionales bacterium]|nr:RimK family protein [Bdellovibrionales bacterium]
IIKTPIQYILGPTEKSFKYRVFNLSSNMGYQEKGYYVSLLAAARKDRVLPSARCVQDLKDRRINKVLSEEISNLVQKNLRSIKSSQFELSIYFGKNISSTYNKLTWELYRIVQAPMFKVFFEKNSSWEIKKINLLTPSLLNEKHLDFLVEAAKNYIQHKKFSKIANNKYLFDLAILHDEKEQFPPSDKKAISKFVRAFQKNGFKPQLIQNCEKPDFNKFDALFIRETTNVTHHTYRIARKAEIDRLIVIDDPDSIVRCTNKVYLEQLLDRLKIKRPKTIIVDAKQFSKSNWNMTFPCVLKQPDSAFSQGVHKANSLEELKILAYKLFKKTELIIIQEFIQTDFDWRVGVLDGEVLFVCKYFMAENHWQIINNNNGKISVGKFENINPSLAPEKILKVALKVANEVGKGLYGIDLKQKNNEIYFIEINDNPNIDSGVEDQFLGEELYNKVAKYFLKECQKKRGIRE